MKRQHRNFFIYLIITLLILPLVYLYCHFKPKSIMVVSPGNETTSNSRLLMENKSEIDTTMVREASLDGDKVNISESEINQRLNPVTMLTEYEGQVSIDVNGYTNLLIGQRISFQYEEKEIILTLNGIYEDVEGLFTYAFTDIDNSDSMFIYNSENGESFISINSPYISFESFLDSNGVGIFKNIRKMRKDGVMNINNNDAVLID